jgi:hypothetical protein
MDKVIEKKIIEAKEHVQIAEKRYFSAIFVSSFY